MRKKIRVFTSSTCRDCKNLLALLKASRIDFYTIDVDDDKNTHICDANEVNRIPHLQVINNGSGQVLNDFIGPISPISFKKLEQALK